jgi:putative hydrolase of the HAD superfamily
VPFIAFDLFHTLVSGADDERDQAVAKMARVLRVEPAALVRAYHDSWPDRLTRWGAAETVDILTRRLGGSPTADEVTRATALRHELATRLLSSVPPATLATLDTLRAAGSRLALVSNATSDTAQAWPDGVLARRFDVAVFSCEVGVAKPDPAIYQAALGRLGAAPEECVFVGDGADRELYGAAALGMTAIRTTEHNDSDPAWSGRTIATLAELPELLRTLG